MLIKKLLRLKRKNYLRNSAQVLLEKALLAANRKVQLRQKRRCCSRHNQTPNCPPPATPSTPKTPFLTNSKVLKY
jgi:hypothetical protein